MEVGSGGGEANLMGASEYSQKEGNMLSFPSYCFFFVGCSVIYSSSLLLAPILFPPPYSQVTFPIYSNTGLQIR